jgi:hypothetical protein
MFVSTFVAGMGLVPDGPGMRQRPVVVFLHGSPGFDHSMLKPHLAPLADVAQLVSSIIVAMAAATRAHRSGGI